MNLIAHLAQRNRATLAVAMLLVAAAAYTTSIRPVYFAESAEVVLPVGYTRARSYPVFVVLPPTGSQASLIAARFGLDPARQRDFVLVFPAGRPTRDEYLPDFLTFVDWYEERLLQDLASVLERYSTDSRRIYLGGYSLGGDLGWALSARNPTLFAGAVVAGSRASYPIAPQALASLREREFRAAFLVGDREDPDRYRGINRARARFDEEGIDHRYREYPGGHTFPPQALLHEMIRYVTDVDLATSPTPSSASTQAGSPRDRLVLTAGVPLEVSGDGFAAARERDIGARLEVPWPRAYLRATAEYTASERSTGRLERRLRQEVVIGAGKPGGFYGAGLGWDWVRRFPEGEAFREVDLLFMRADREPWIVPAGSDPLRVDSLLTVRYTIPRGIGTGVLAHQVLNLRAGYLLRIADLLVLDLGLGAYTVQNRAVDTIAELPQALDRRLEWEAGAGIRLPSPVLWRLSHRGTGERTLPDGEFAYRGAWRLSIEYSF